MWLKWLCDNHISNIAASVVERGCLFFWKDTDMRTIDFQVQQVTVLEYVQKRAYKSKIQKFGFGSQELD